MPAFLDPRWQSYFDRSVVILSGLAAFFGLASVAADALFRWKAATHFGGGLCLLFAFLSFLMFNRYGYMYYSELFFGGIELRLIFSMYYGYLFSLLIYIVQNTERPPQTQQSKQDEKAEKYSAGK